MTYSIIQPPFTLNFKEMSKKELKNYFNWFHGILPSRLDELKRAVQVTSGYELWSGNFAPESLNLLGEWYAIQVETRPRTNEEIAEIENRLTFPIAIPKVDLTKRTFSLAMDVGMYLSQVFLKNHSGLHWDQPLNNKKFVDYGRPVLLGFGVVPFNPVRMVITLGYSIASKDENGKGLRELYDIWVNMIRV